MTHDELLAKINEKYHYQGFDYELSNKDKALRAVVELHKPKSWYPDGIYEKIKCSGCTHPWYPCPTIQAIEKELS